MSKIILVGGSSELGNAVAERLLSSNSSGYGSIIKLSTSLQSENSFNWNPTNFESTLAGLHEIHVDRNDCVVVALGKLLERQTLDESSVATLSLYNILNVNFIVPLLSISYFFNELKGKQGGRIILLSSTAAFPVLDGNFLYGLAKLSLDMYAQYLQRTPGNSKVQVVIVRSGFVNTKLNKGRTPTPFSRTPEEVANLVVRNLHKRVIWTPPIFQLICFLLTRIKPLKLIANYLVRQSKI